MEKYIVVQWPDIQTYMDKEGFEDNAYLINDERGIELFGSSAYFINEEWADKVDSQDVLWKEISAALANTSEEEHMKVNIIVSTPEDQGLNDNEKPVISEIWQHPTEGIITFKLQGSDEDFVSSWASDEENQKIALIALIPFLDTLETKEVDLEKEIYDYFNEWQNVLCDEDCCNEGGFCCVLDENVKPVNIERCRKVAKHFFKLGINSK